MKKLVIFLIGILIVGSLFSQTSNTFKYVINANAGVKTPLGNLMNSQVGVFNVLDYGAKADSLTDCASAFIATDVAAYPNGTVYIPDGVYKINSQVTFRNNLDAAGAKIYINDSTKNAIKWVGYTGTGDAPHYYQNKVVFFPSVYNTKHTTAGGWGADTGIVIVNAKYTKFWINYVMNFGVGVRITNTTDNGCSYNTYSLGSIYNNKIGLHFNPINGTGWTNENIFIAGGFQYVESEGTNISGARCVLIDSSTQIVSNNVFLKPNFEGSGAEYTVENFGSDNAIYNARWEGTPKVKYTELSEALTPVGNGIYGGQNSEYIAFTLATHPDANFTFNPNEIYYPSRGGFVSQNFASNANPSFAAMDLADSYSTNPYTEYGWSAGYLYTKMQSAGDAGPRMQFNHSDGSINWGNGGGSFTVILERRTTGIMKLTGNLEATAGFTVLPSDTTVAKAYGKLVFQTSDSTLYVCRFIRPSGKKCWFPLN